MTGGVGEDRLFSGPAKVADLGTEAANAGALGEAEAGAVA
jgi:hypothetical protein